MSAPRRARPACRRRRRRLLQRLRPSESASRPLSSPKKHRRRAVDDLGPDEEPLREDKRASVSLLVGAGLGRSRRSDARQGHCRRTTWSVTYAHEGRLEESERERSAPCTARQDHCAQERRSARARQRRRGRRRTKPDAENAHAMSTCSPELKRESATRPSERQREGERTDHRRLQHNFARLLEQLAAPLQLGVPSD